MTYLRIKKGAFQHNTNASLTPNTATSISPVAIKHLGLVGDRDTRLITTSDAPHLISSVTARRPERLFSGAERKGFEHTVSKESKFRHPYQSKGFDFNLEYLRHAKLDPPVTKTAFSELDLERIIDNPRLRHDLNFDSVVAFRPNVDGSQSKRKAAEAKMYWDALVVELELYIDRQHQTYQDAIAVPPRTSIIRLPRMFLVIREILQTLISQDQRATIKTHLDIDTIGQELEYGVCDFIGVIEWLGSVLIGSCSPLRDDLIFGTIAELKRGVYRNDSHKIVDGLRSLFGILEMMRLDIANHQIRYLRLFMIEDTIQFEQRYFLNKIANGWNVAGAYAWYQAPIGIPASDASSQDSKLLAFAEDIVDMVVSNHTRFPATFIFDFKRLRLLQRGFQKCKQQENYTRVFSKLVKERGWAGQIPISSIRSLLSRLCVLQDHEETEITAYTSNDAIALEIAREIAKLCHPSDIPTEQLVKDTGSQLQDLSNTPPCSIEDWDHPLCYNLAKTVEQKVTDVMGLNPLQMHNYFLVQISKAERGPVESALDEIGKTIAHIALLHWRVWIPILYENPSYANLAGTLVGNHHPQPTTTSTVDFSMGNSPEVRHSPNPET